MNNRTLFIAIIGGLVAILVCTGCEDEKCGNARRFRYAYEFKAPVSIEPARESYSVGDTIEVQVSIPRKMVDTRNDVVEEIISQNVSHGAWVIDVSSDFSTIDATNFVTFFFDEETVGAFAIVEFSGNSTLRGVFDSSLNSDTIASIRYRFVLKQVGVFWFTFLGNLAAEAEGGPFLEIANRCSNGYIQLFYEVNGGADNNFSILCETEDVFCTPTYAESNRGPAFDNRAGYVFKVTE